MTFDPLAPTYDQDFTHTRIAEYLRTQVHTRLERHFNEGDSVLELGCGTGEDALHLARRGVQMMATDVSEQMLAMARTKVGNHSHIAFKQIDLAHLPELDETQLFDGVFSNFGPLNVLSDWRPLATWLSQRVKPNGIAAFGLMSPLCLWEMAWHGLHGNFPTATRRLRKKSTFKADHAAKAINIYYPSIRRLRQDFAPYFRRIHVQGLGLFLPPSDVYGVIEKRPRLLNTLLALEKLFAPIPALALFADHYWIEFQRVE